MGAAGFHGRVRDGVGWDTRAVTTGSAGRRLASMGAPDGARFLVYRPCGLLEPRKLWKLAETVCLGRVGMLQDRPGVPGRSLGWGRR